MKRRGWRVQFGLLRRLYPLLWGAAVLMAAVPRRLGADAIPVFARKYRTTCSTCHTAAPKLNVLGEAFRLNAYHLPENDLLLRKDNPVPLGEEPWKDLWPRAIWPGEISGTAPFALRLQNDLQVARKATAGYAVTYRFPNAAYVLAASTLGETMGAFLEMAWTRESGLQLVQGKIKFQDVVPGLPRRLVNFWLGLQNLYLLTFANPQIDRAGRQAFLWQEIRISDLELANPLTGQRRRSLDNFQVARAEPALELNGLLMRRLYYAVGLAQGAGSGTADNNARKDLYYKVRYKFGGLRLDGTYQTGGGPRPGGHGQLQDRSLVVEHFGYFGAEPVVANRQDTHRWVGFAGRLLFDRVDIGVGYVWGRHDDPWGTGTGGVRVASPFGKAEYMVFPWLIGSLKLDRFDLNPPATARPAGFSLGSLDQTRLVPGFAFLVRQNIRGVVELEVFPRHAPSAALGQPRPRNLWLRLDIAF